MGRGIKIVAIAALFALLGCTGSFFGIGWLYRTTNTQYRTAHTFADCTVTEEMFSAGAWDSTHVTYHLKCGRSASQIILDGTSIDDISFDSLSPVTLDIYTSDGTAYQRSDTYHLPSGKTLAIRHIPESKPH